jgi:hypothetical protein
MKIIWAALILLCGCPSSQTFVVTIDTPVPSTLRTTDAVLSFSANQKSTYTARLIRGGAPVAVVSRGSAPANQSVEVAIDVAAIAAGDYVIRIEARNAQGKIATTEQQFLREPLAKASLASAQNALVFDLGAQIEIIIEASGDLVTLSSTVDPPLPSFLSLDIARGVISGMATESLPTTSYKFTASNRESAAELILSLRVRAPLSATLTGPPAPTGSVLGSHDVNAQSLFLTTDADMVECFDGTLPMACDPARPRLPLAPTGQVGEHLFKPLRVRVSKTNADPIELVFTPEASTRVFTCDEIVSANESAAELQNRLNRAGTICLGDVTIGWTNTTTVSFAAPANRLIGLVADPAVLEQPDSPATMLTIQPTSVRTTLANLRLVGTGDDTIGIVAETRPDCAGACPPLVTLLIDNVDFSGGLSSGGFFGVIELMDYRRTTTLRASRVTNRTNLVGLAATELSTALRIDSGDLVMTDSTLESEGSALLSLAAATVTARRTNFVTSYENQQLNGAIVVRGPTHLEDCDIEGNYTGLVAFGVGASNAARVTRGRIVAPVASVIVGGDMGVGHLQGQLAIDGATLECSNNCIELFNGRAVVDGVRFVRRNTPDADESSGREGSYAIRIVNSGGVLADLDSTRNDNLYCFAAAQNQFSLASQPAAPSGTLMTPVFGTTAPAGADAFVYSQQQNGGAQVLCP